MLDYIQAVIKVKGSPCDGVARWWLVYNGATRIHLLCMN